MARQRNRTDAPHPAPPVDGEPEKRRAILHAALKVFAERGYHGCRIADVASEAGVAYGLVYHYFRNKDELLESVFDEQWRIFIGAIRAIAEGPGSAAEQIASVIRFALDVFRTAPAAVRVLILEVPRTPDVLRAGSTRQTFETAMRLIAEMVQRGQREGELRSDLEPLVARRERPRRARHEPGRHGDRAAHRAPALRGGPGADEAPGRRGGAGRGRSRRARPPRHVEPPGSAVNSRGPPAAAVQESTCPTASSSPTTSPPRRSRSSAGAGLEVDVRVGMKPEELEAAIGDYDAIAVRSATKVTARVLEKASRLRVVGRAGVGIDNVDLEAATRRGVVVMNTPGGSSVTVAELALGMMLALSRHIAAGHRLHQGRQVGEEALPGARAGRQDARRGRHRQHRLGGGGPRPGP